VNAYVIAGWIVALGGTGLYAAWTIITSRKIASQVLAIEDAMNPGAGSAWPDSGARPDVVEKGQQSHA
jgi:hypothetical protein